MSLIGMAMAGAAEGAGKAAQDSMMQEQKYQDQSDLIKMQSQLDEQKQMRVMEQQQNYNVQNAATAHGYAKELQGDNNQFQLDLHDSDNDAASDRLDKQITSQQTMEKWRIDSNERISAAANATSLQAAALGHVSYQTTGDGHIVALTPDKDGNVTAKTLTDPETNKPLVGQKDMPQSQILLAKSYFDEAEALKMTDPDKAAQSRQIGRQIMEGKGGNNVLDVSNMPANAINRLMAQGAPSAAQINQFNAAAQAAGYGPSAFQRWSVLKTQATGAGIIAGAQGGDGDLGSTPGQPPSPAVTAASAASANTSMPNGQATDGSIQPPIPRGPLGAQRNGPSRPVQTAQPAPGPSKFVSRQATGSHGYEQGNSY